MKNKLSVIILSIFILASVLSTNRTMADYPATMTTNSPCINLPRPGNDPRWAEALAHWDKRAETREVNAALPIFEAIAADKPNMVEAHIWVLRVNYLAAMRHRSKRNEYIQKAIAAGDAALKIDPDNVFALYWQMAATVLYREVSKKEYDVIKDFNAKYLREREIPVPGNDPLWTEAMNIWDARLTESDMKKIEENLGNRKELEESDVGHITAKAIAAVAAFEKIEKKYPGRIEPILWLTHSNYWLSQMHVDSPKRAAAAKTAVAWGKKALKMEPLNPIANFFQALNLSEVGVSTSLMTLTKYSKEIGQRLQIVTEEDPNYNFGGFSRYFSGAIAVAGPLLIKVANLLGFPKELIIRLTEYCAKTEPLFLSNLFNLGELYYKLDKKEEALKAYKKAIAGDPTALKYQEAENRFAILQAKLAIAQKF